MTTKYAVASMIIAFLTLCFAIASFFNFGPPIITKSIYFKRDTNNHTISTNAKKYEQTISSNAKILKKIPHIQENQGNNDTVVETSLSALIEENKPRKFASIKTNISINFDQYDGETYGTLIISPYKEKARREPILGSVEPFVFVSDNKQYRLNVLNVNMKEKTVELDIYPLD